MNLKKHKTRQKLIMIYYKINQKMTMMIYKKNKKIIMKNFKRNQKMILIWLKIKLNKSMKNYKNKAKMN